MCARGSRCVKVWLRCCGEGRSLIRNTWTQPVHRQGMLTTCGQTSACCTVDWCTILYWDLLQPSFYIFYLFFIFFWMKLKWWNTRECFSFFFLVLAHFLQKPFFSSTRTFRCFNKYYMKYRMCRMCVSLWLFRANYSSNAHNIFTVTPKTNRNFKSLLFLLWKRLAHFLCTTSTLSHNHTHLPPGGRLAL